MEYALVISESIRLALGIALALPWTAGVGVVVVWWCTSLLFR